VSDPIRPISGREGGPREVSPVDRLRLLSPAEREDARRKREDARRKAKKWTAGRPPRKSPQGDRGGVDYSA
jgi:hypothetical protein